MFSSRCFRLQPDALSFRIDLRVVDVPRGWGPPLLFVDLPPHLGPTRVLVLSLRSFRPFRPAVPSRPGGSFRVRPDPRHLDFLHGRGRSPRTDLAEVKEGERAPVHDDGFPVEVRREWTSLWTETTGEPRGVTFVSPGLKPRRSAHCHTRRTTLQVFTFGRNFLPVQGDHPLYHNHAAFVL